jgi:hypothetical protein
MKRKTVYINLHPDYDYSTAIIQGYMDIRDYVRNVDWLIWEKPHQLVISGSIKDKEKAKEQHIQRAKVFAQRMKSCGFTVLVRNSRGEEWQEFIFDEISEDEMIEAELEFFDEPQTIYRARENIEKYRELLTGDKEKDELIFASIESEEYTIRVANEKELQRQEIIKSFWHKDDEDEEDEEDEEIMKKIEECQKDLFYVVE